MTFDDYLERFRHRVLQDAITEALPATWIRRAEQFEWAKSRPGDHVVDEAEQAERDKELDSLAEECRRRAAAREKLDLDWWGPLIKEALDAQEQVHP